MPEPKKDALVEYNEAFLKRIAKLKTAMHKKYMDTSKEPTSAFDGSGNPIIKKRLDGYDYLEELYMRTKLDELFPGWSWEGLFTQFMAYEWVWVGGHLVIIDEYLLAFSIVPPIRKFYAVGAARIMFKSGMPHTPENIIDISNNLKSANSSALKVGINRLCRIGDDVYGKRFDEEGTGSLEKFMTDNDTNPSIARNLFFGELTKKKMLHSKTMERLGVKNWNEITDWQKAYNKIFKGGE